MTTCLWDRVEEILLMSTFNDIGKQLGPGHCGLEDVLVWPCYFQCPDQRGAPVAAGHGRKSEIIIPVRSNIRIPRKVDLYGADTFFFSTPSCNWA